MSEAIATAVCLADYECLAQRVLSAQAWAYFAGGSADELTMRWNRSAFDRLALMPRVLRGGPGGSTKTTLLGQEIAHPILVAPLAYQRLAHADGELATAMAADAQEALMVLSTQASVTIEAAAKAGATCRWFQLYFQPEREATLHLVRRAVDAGYKALVVTVDAPINGVRNREHRTGFQLPPDIAAVNLQGLPAPPPRSPSGASVVFSQFVSQAPSWNDIAWLKSQTSLPIILKGILSPDDAVLAIESGVDGIVVSNHGGRTLDTALASLDALPAVATVVAGRVPVLLDGGVRRGTDVLKALALGASAVLVGRPVIFGLAANGAFGVSHVLRLLRDELEVAMALTGCRSVTEIGPHLVRNAE
ncbi:MAG: alpha-hydroxy-acid oxidizing protein [Hyphomicrobium sp.]|nr:alpha-hydroxy-acid oxidizing protein [Hyphomicrobium sp.]